MRISLTYVLGYEVSPFQEDANGRGFCAALACMPKAWECSACWDTYTMGFLGTAANSISPISPIAHVKRFPIAENAL